GARWLVEHGATLVGIDSVNIDDTSTGERHAHTVLLAAGIPIVEHLTGLDALPHTGAFFTAAPPTFRGLAMFPVRAAPPLPGPGIGHYADIVPRRASGSAMRCGATVRCRNRRRTEVAGRSTRSRAESLLLDLLQPVPSTTFQVPPTNRSPQPRGRLPQTR